MPKRLVTVPRDFCAGFLTGIRGYLRVPVVLTRHRLWHYLLAPAVISLVLGIVVLLMVIYGIGWLASWIDGQIEISAAWLDSTVHWSLAILSTVLGLLAFVFFHKHLVLILLAPLLGRLTELTARAVVGKEKFVPKLGVKLAILRALRINLRLMLFELLWAALYFAIGIFVPVVGSLITATLVFINQARNTGRGLMDFPLEYYGYDPKRSIAYTRKRRPMATGLGTGYLLLMLIPFVGWMFAPTLAAVAGTLETMEDLEGEADGEPLPDKAPDQDPALLGDPRSPDEPSSTDDGAHDEEEEGGDKGEPPVGSSEQLKDPTPS